MIGAIIGSAIASVAGSALSSRASSSAARDAAEASVESTKLQIGAAERAREEGVKAARKGNKQATRALTAAYDEEGNILRGAAKDAAGRRVDASRDAQRATVGGMKDAADTLVGGERDAKGFSIKALMDSNKEFKSAFNDVSESTEAWRTAGENAMRYLDAGLESGRFSMDSFKFRADPGYKFRQEQGEKALTRAAAARGNFLSGEGLADAMDFNQGLASQEYQAAWDRGLASRAQDYNTLTGAADRGYQAVSDLNQYRDILGQRLSANDIAAGDVRAGMARNIAAIRGAQQEGVAGVRAQGIDERGNILADRSEVVGAIDASVPIKTAQAEAQAALNIAAAGQQGAVNVGNVGVGAYGDQGNILAQMHMNQGNAAAQGWQGAAAGVNQGVENFMLMNMLKDN